MRVESILPIAQQRMMTVRCNASVVDASNLLSDTHRALLVVCERDGAMVGEITKTDVVMRLARRNDRECHLGSNSNRSELPPRGNPGAVWNWNRLLM
jgi:CBS-domain-containing membrane protein